jgi:hypothetical protein
MVFASPGRDPWIVHVLGFVTAGITSFFLVRSLRWGTIDVDKDRIVIRGRFRTLKLAAGEIDRFQVVAGTSISRTPAIALAVRTRLGTITVLDEFWSSSDTLDPGVEQLAMRLNGWIVSGKPDASSPT